MAVPKGVRIGGRPPGGLNKRTIARQAMQVASGMSPLDYMLSVMRDAKVDKAVRLDAAKAAAPYVHPRLAAIDHTGGVTLTLEQIITAAGQLAIEQADEAIMVEHTLSEDATARPEGE